MRALLLALVLSAHVAAYAEDEPPIADAATLVANLSAEEPGIRTIAAEELAKIPQGAFDAGAVPLLVEIALSDTHIEAREQALWALGELGPLGRDNALEPLRTLLDPMNPSPGRIQGIAAWAFGRMEPPIDVAAKALLPLLLSFDEFTRMAAADGIAAVGPEMIPMLLLTTDAMEGRLYREGIVESLANMGEDAAPAIPALLEWQRTADSAYFRRRIDGALTQMGHVDVQGRVDRLVTDMQGAPDHTRYLNIVALGKLGPQAESAVPALIEALADDHTARVALEALGAITTEDDWPAVVEATEPLLGIAGWEGTSCAVHLASFGEPGRALLARGISDPSAIVRRNAVHGLAGVEPDAGKEAFKILRRLLQSDPSGELRVDAARALARYGARALPTLQRAIDHEQDGYFRSQLVSALEPLGLDALPIWRSELTSEYEYVRSAAAYNIGGLEPPVVELVPDLLLAASRDIGGGSAVQAIETFGEPAVPFLIEGLRSASPAVRKEAALCLGRIGEPAVAAVPDLARALDDDDKGVRQWAAFALGRMGSAAGGAVEDLRAALTDPEPWVRGNAAEALGGIGYPDATLAIPDLVDVVVHDRSYEPPNKAAEALGKFGPMASEAIQPLAAALEREDKDRLRAAAARTLGEIGLPDAYARAQLRGALDDPRARVRLAAAEALLVIGTEGDVVEAAFVARKAEDDVWEESMQFIEIELPPPPIEPLEELDEPIE